MGKNIEELLLSTIVDNLAKTLNEQTYLATQITIYMSVFSAITNLDKTKEYKF